MVILLVVVSGGIQKLVLVSFTYNTDGDVVMNNITGSNAIISGNITITGGSAQKWFRFIKNTISLQSSVTTLRQAQFIKFRHKSLQTNIDNVET